jgi:hypothetical protein
MKLENLHSNKATTKLAKAPFCWKILIFTLATLPTVTLAERVSTRWYTAEAGPSWERLSDPSGLASLILRRVDHPEISLNIVRSSEPSKDEIKLAITRDYARIGLQVSRAEHLSSPPQQFPIESVEILYGTSGAKDAGLRFAVIGRWPSIDDSTLWLTLLAPEQQRERALDIYKEFLTQLSIVAPDSDPKSPTSQPSSGNATTLWFLATAGLAGMIVGGWIYLTRRNHKNTT